jgi:hypothetical protein
MTTADFLAKLGFASGEAGLQELQTEYCLYREALCAIASGGKTEPWASRRALAALQARQNGGIIAATLPLPSEPE